MLGMLSAIEKETNQPRRAVGKGKCSLLSGRGRFVLAGVESATKYPRSSRSRKSRSGDKSTIYRRSKNVNIQTNVKYVYEEN